MAVKPKKSKAAGGGGEKVKFLTVLPADTIKALKLRAIERGVTASSILEDAVVAWTRRHRNFTRKTLDERKGELRQFLSRMDAGVVRDLKVMAIDWHVTASALVGQAVMKALKQKF
jgi:hypothetical protein